MKHKRICYIVVLMLIMAILSTTAFAIEESEVENAIAASSQDEVAGNVFIWFLCAVAFLKVSQKIDSFMSSLGVNVGRTGGSMLGELMIAGRAIGSAVRATGSVAGSIFNRKTASNNTSNRAAGQVFNGSGGGVIGVAKRAAGNAAAASATGRCSGMSGLVGGAMFDSSMKSGGKLAADVVSGVATGSFAAVGSITGAKAAQALTSYLGYQSGTPDTATGTPDTAMGMPVNNGAVSPQFGGQVSVPPTQQGDTGGDTGGVVAGEDVVTLDGGMAAGASIGMTPNSIPGTPITPGTPGSTPGTSGPASSIPDVTQPHAVPAQPPTFRNVEIGGGRITGYETPAGGGEERQFAMYNVNQYMEPTGTYETVQTTDGESWYKQYAEPVVQKTPYQDGEDGSKIKYEQKIVQQMPQIPKRKDKV